MKFLTKTTFESGTLLRSPVDTGERMPDSGKDRVNIYPVERQKILGFGGAFTESAAYVYAGLDSDRKREVLERLFGKSGLGYNFCRISIGSSDFSLDMNVVTMPQALVTTIKNQKKSKKCEKGLDKREVLCYNIARWVRCYGSVGRAHPW